MQLQWITFSLYVQICPFRARAWATRPSCFRRLDLGRRLSPAVAGCRRGPPGAASKIVVFHRFFVHWRPKIVKNRCFFNVFRTKSLKIVVFLLFFKQIRPKSLKIVVFLLFSVQIRPKSLKIVVFLLFFVHFPSNIAKNCDYI